MAGTMITMNGRVVQSNAGIFPAAGKRKCPKCGKLHSSKGKYCMGSYCGVYNH